MPPSSDETTLPLLRRHLNVYLEGAAGVPYETLVAFAEPLFELFQVDPRNATLRGASRQADELATILSTLDLARLFWAYFLLDPDEMPQAHALLQHALLDDPPGPDDLAALDDLIQLLEERWFTLTSGDVVTRSNGYALPPFAELLDAYEHRQGSPTTYTPSVDAMHSDRPDALATFARPLFEAADPNDPASIDDALARAQAYWELAQTPEADYEDRLTRVAKRFATADRSSEAVRSEADAMRRRFHELFKR